MPRLLTLILCFAIILPLGVQAQEAPELVLPEQADVRIIVDISGSMKKNDPDNLRQPAVRLLAQMLPEGATAGLWTFGQYVNMLVPHREVTEQWRALAKDRSAQINSVALRTNLGKAIEVAGDTYYTDGVLDNTHFILLTDGRVDISDDGAVNEQEESRILQTIAPGLTAQGATFHPIALSSEADADFLRQLARDSGGRFQVAESAEALSRAFLEALNTAVPQEQIPIEGDGFRVDEGVSEFTALVFWGQQETRETRKLALVSPGGERVTLDALPANVRWTRESGYDLMTITEPASGRWQIDGELGEGSRVTVVSDLRMAVSPIPPEFSEQSPINLNIAFYEDGERITNQDFLQVLDIKVSVVSEDGRSGTKVLSRETSPEPGVFTDTIGRLPANGLYQIEVVADGQTFSRKFSTTTQFESIVAGQSTADIEGGEVATTDQESTESEPVSGAAPVADPASAADPEPVSEPEPKPETKPEPQNQPAPASTPTVADDIISPINVDEVEQPEEPTEEASGFAMPPLWMLGAGGGVFALAALAWFVVKRRSAKTTEETVEPDTPKTSEAQSEQPAADPEPTEDTDEPEPEAQDEPEEQAEEPPVAEVVAAEASEDEATGEIPEVTDELDAGAESVEAEEQAQEEDAELPDDDIPMADTVVSEEPESVEAEQESETESEQASADDWLDELTDDSAEDSDEEEFGLDDFDLSEFDDLPGHNDSDTDQTDLEPIPDADDQDQKK